LRKQRGTSNSMSSRAAFRFEVPTRVCCWCCRNFKSAARVYCPFRRGLSWARVIPMRTDLFDFDLPPERIALRPVSPRDAARLLVIRSGGAPEFEDRAVNDLPQLLNPGDALVV